MSGPLLELAGLTVSAGRGPDQRTIIDGIDLTVERGEIVAIVGESGCGKTVTMLSILGALPVGLAMTVDRLRFDDTPCETPRARRAVAAARKMALIPADVGAALNPLQRVGSQLDDGIKLRKGRSSRGARRSQALELLTRVGLRDPARASRAYPHELSGGMQQRAAIALGIEPDPLLIVADEPTTALDVTIQAQVLQLLLDVREERGCSILFVTHDMTAVAEICDRVVVMYAGQVVESGPVADVGNDPRHPYTTALIEAVPPLGGQPTTRLQTIGGGPPEPGRWPTGCRFSPRCGLRTLLGEPQRCDDEQPELRRQSDGRLVRCHFAGETIRPDHPVGAGAGETR